MELNLGTELNHSFISNDSLQKHGIVLGPDLSIGGEAGGEVTDGAACAEGREGSSFLGKLPPETLLPQISPVLRRFGLLCFCLFFVSVPQFSIMCHYSALLILSVLVSDRERSPGVS